MSALPSIDLFSARAVEASAVEASGPGRERPEATTLDAMTLARFGVSLGADAITPNESVLPLDWPEFERILPGGGLPRGVVEIAAMPLFHASSISGSPAARFSSMRGGATTIALAAVRAAQKADPGAWCAWITPDDPAHPAPSLYAPAVLQAEVEVDRLLIVRPSPKALARTAVKVAASGAFDLVVVDAPTGLDGRLDPASAPASRAEGLGLSRPHAGSRAVSGGKVDASVVVRKLALAAEEQGTSSLLLTSALTPSSVPLPVALRLEVERRPESLSVRITKDRRGRGSSQHVVRLAC